MVGNRGGSSLCRRVCSDLLGPRIYQCIPCRHLSLHVAVCCGAGPQLFIPDENLQMIQVIGLCCAFPGIVVAFSESLTDPTRRMLIGDSMLAVAAILWGATTVLIKASPLPTITPSKTLLYQLSYPRWSPLGPWQWRGRNCPDDAVDRRQPRLSMVWVAFITYLAWFWLIRHYPPSRLASFTFLTPLFGVLAGGLLLNEPIRSDCYLALVLVGTGFTW